MTQVLMWVCLICSQPMAPCQLTDLDSGVVVHVPCRSAHHRHFKSREGRPLQGGRRRVVRKGGSRC